MTKRLKEKYGLIHREAPKRLRNKKGRFTGLPLHKIICACFAVFDTDEEFKKHCQKEHISEGE